MTYVDLPIVILENPLMFMNGEYCKEHLLKDKYSKGEITEILQDEIPKKMIIKFKEETLIDEFISQYNNKPLTDKLNYNLTLTKSDKKCGKQSNL